MKIKRRHIKMARAADRLQIWQDCIRQWPKWRAVVRWHRAANHKGAKQ